MELFKHGMSSVKLRPVNNNNTLFDAPPTNSKSVNTLWTHYQRYQMRCT